MENISTRFPQVQVKTYKLDLMSTDVNDYKKVADSLQDLDISILINNAGFAKFHKFGEGDVRDVERMVKTNMGPYCYLTHFLIDKLAQREVGRRSAIIFVSSSGGDLILPYLSTYVATKAFNDHFAQSLSYEL